MTPASPDTRNVTDVLALLIPADTSEPTEIVRIDGSTDGVARAIAAHTVNVVELGDDVAVWVDEYGQLEGAPVNPRACRLVNSFLPGYTRRDLLHGPAVVVGMDEDTAVYRDLPGYVIERQRNLA